MTYAIVNVMYGVPLSHNQYPEERSELIQVAIEEADTDKDEAGFHRFYSGGSDVTPAAFGIILGKFDEATHHTEMSEVLKEPTQEQLLKFQEALEALGPELYVSLSEYGKPRVFLLWSTS